MKSLPDFSDERVAKLMAAESGLAMDRDQVTRLKELIDLHQELSETDERASQEARQAFLLTVQRQPDIIVDEAILCFLLDHVKSEDYAAFEWESPQQAIQYCSIIYSTPFESEEVADRVRIHVQQMLGHALLDFERRGEYEKMFQLLQIAPLPSLLTHPELFRLRNRAHLYEMARVQKARRFLYAYLIVQAMLILFIFPGLFINAENGVIQQQIEEIADVDLPDNYRRQFLSYTDGLYWAVITAGSIGYGDVTPVTSIGKALAGMLGIMGVITIGVVAGLILTWVSPRSIE
jgi:hypothetical protein